MIQTSKKLNIIKVFEAITIEDIKLVPHVERERYYINIKLPIKSKL